MTRPVTRHRSRITTAMWQCRGQGNRDVAAQWLFGGERVRPAGQMLPMVRLPPSCGVWLPELTASVEH